MTKLQFTAAALENLKQICQERANAMECDCPEEKKTYTVKLTTDEDCNNGQGGDLGLLHGNFVVAYTNNCGTAKSLNVTATGRRYGGTDTLSYNTTISIPNGTGSFKHSFYFDVAIVCHTFRISGGGTFDC